MGDTLYLIHTSSHMVYSPHTKYFREKNVGCRSFTFTSRIHQEVISFLHVVSYYILSVLFFVWFSLGCMSNLYVHVTFYERIKNMKRKLKTNSCLLNTLIINRNVKNSTIDRNIDNHCWIPIDSFYQSNWIT